MKKSSNILLVSIMSSAVQGNLRTYEKNIDNIFFLGLTLYVVFILLTVAIYVVCGLLDTEFTSIFFSSIVIWFFVLLNAYRYRNVLKKAICCDPDVLKEYIFLASSSSILLYLVLLLGNVFILLPPNIALFIYAFMILPSIPIVVSFWEAKMLKKLVNITSRFKPLGSLNSNELCGILKFLDRLITKGFLKVSDVDVLKFRRTLNLFVNVAESLVPSLADTIRRVLSYSELEKVDRVIDEGEKSRKSSRMIMFYGYVVIIYEAIFILMQRGKLLLNSWQLTILAYIFIYILGGLLILTGMYSMSNGTLLTKIPKPPDENIQKAAYNAIRDIVKLITRRTSQPLLLRLHGDYPSTRRIILPKTVLTIIQPYKKHTDRQ